jgi:ATP-binding cassette subfamily B protein
VERVAKLAQIHDFIVSLPQGYATWVGERGITLSGGQKQRVAIARTLLMDPPVLLLDDSTSSLDTETEHALLQATRTVVRNRTTIMVTQRLDSAGDADLILFLDKGRIAESGTHQELMARRGHYYQVYELQRTARSRTVLSVEDAFAKQSGEAGSAPERPGTHA